jgi:hypothetical protein
MRTREASLVWRYLNGITCLYKPPNMSVKTVRYTIKKHLSEGMQIIVNFYNKHTHSSVPAMTKLICLLNPQISI